MPIPAQITIGVGNKLGSDTLVLADRGLGNTTTVLAARKTGAHALVRVKTGSNAARYPIEALLADGSWRHGTSSGRPTNRYAPV